MKLLKEINWPTAMVLIVGMGFIWATAMWGKDLGLPAEAHQEFVAAIGSLSALLAAWAPKLFGQDSDGDKIPDFLDADSTEEKLAPEDKP